MPRRFGMNGRRKWARIWRLWKRREVGVGARMERMMGRRLMKMMGRERMFSLSGIVC
jgi:hypothetical protein